MIDDLDYMICGIAPQGPHVAVLTYSDVIKKDRFFSDFLRLTFLSCVTSELSCIERFLVDTILSKPQK